MKSVAITDFKAHCLALLEDVARTGEPLLITKRGKPLTRVVPSGELAGRYSQSSLAGTVTIQGDIVEPVLPASAWDAVRGEVLPSRKKRAKRRSRSRA
ncbi:MAG TPA: type II toxin-antitoxin system Phd/YefM family antitoxin [Labilithrix sp.]|jgi:prevent-host-death family protein|nr:type II toxin-antitoxin system Phd/YefM family antitoxin [Labilithrix sp.]